MIPQETIAHYRITGKLGEGGMGEVYRAMDTKLGREVAIKILPEAFAADADRMARFTREAQVLASLNHPNIAAIYGVEDRALVMELVEGETLKGPLPLKTALDYSRQIIDALESAHEKGIVHRDLKPANIKITPEGNLKVLDFGLAKAGEEPVSVAGSATISPTLTIAATKAGMIMGTAAYMAPEQARGSPVDRRADIWAFGAVLYEMLSGRMAFEGATISDVLAAVLTKDPDWSALPPSTPSNIRRLLSLCLAKDRKQRLQAIGDARILFSENREEPPSRARTGLPWWAPWGFAAVAAVLAAVLAAVALWQASRAAGTPVDRPLVRLDLDMGPGVTLASAVGANVILSPDGSRLVFVAEDSMSTRHLFTRRLDQPAPAELPGTGGAFSPFISPDGEWVAFFAEGKLKKTAFAGGAPVVLCDAPNPRGGAWGEDGNIIAELDIRGPLSRISSQGSAPASLTQLDKGRGELSHRWPQLLPGGKAVLFTSHINPTGFETASIAVLDLTNNRKKMLPLTGTSGRYAPSGHVLYVNGATLYAAKFDANRLELLGPPAPVIDRVMYSRLTGAAEFDVSQMGTMVYRVGGRESGRPTIQWLWPDGRTVPLLAKPGEYLFPRVSPEGARVTFTSSEGSRTNVWLYDRQRDTLGRLTYGLGYDSSPVWTPDGQFVVFYSQGGIFFRRADGAGKTELLTSSKNSQYPSSFTKDGKWLAFAEANPATSWDIWTVPVQTEAGRLRAGKPQPVLNTHFSEMYPAFSPDGRWLAYASNENGKFDVFVRAFPESGARWQISNNGGDKPVWSPNGHELLFRAESGHVMAATYRWSGDSFVADKPRFWSQKITADVGFASNFDIAPDGKSVVALIAPESGEDERDRGRVVFVQNFFDELRRRTAKGGK